MELLLLLAYLVLQVGDYWTTTKVLSQGGYEENPIVAKVLDKLGVPLGLLVVKSLGAILGVVLYWLDALYALSGVTALYAYVVYKNYGYIRD